MQYFSRIPGPSRPSGLTILQLSVQAADFKEHFTVTVLLYRNIIELNLGGSNCMC